MNKLVALLLGLVITITLVACGRTGTSSESPSVPETNSTTQSPSQEDLIAETTSAEENRVNEDSSEILVRLTFDGGEAIVLLKDNAAARNFATQLPLTQTFEDFNSIEKICRLSEEITTEGVEKGVDPEVADITLYLPWNTLVFYYEDYGYNDDLVPIGHVESGIELLADMGDEFEVTMELMEGNNTSTLVVYFSMPETTDPNNMTAEEENSTADYFNATI